MSVKLISAVLDGSLPPTETLIMLALADYADETGKCWPAKETIARRARVSKRTADKYIGKLVESGWITITTSSNGRSSNIYHLNIERINDDANRADLAPLKQTQPCRPCTVETDSTVQHSLHPYHASHAAPEPSLNQKKKIVRSHSRSLTDHAWFVRWWSHAFQIKTGNTYAITSKAAGIIKNLLKSLDLGNITARACAYLALHPADRFPKGSPTLEGFSSMINQVANAFDETTDTEFVSLGLLPEDGPIDTTTFRPWERS